MSDQRPSSRGEFEALPVGPEFGCLVHNVSDLDRSRGWTVIGGKRSNVDSRCRAVKIPQAKPTVAVFFGPGEPLMYWLDGEHWTLGRYADGVWFRQRTGL